MCLPPANSIWLPSKNAWTLVYFGCASRAGAAADLSFSLWYAPPEVIAAYKAGKRTLVAAPSADVWALGVRCGAVVARCELGLRLQLMHSLPIAARCLQALFAFARMPCQLGISFSSTPRSARKPLCTLQVMTWELLTKTKFYGEDADMAAVVDTLTGKTALASERDLTLEVYRGLANQTFRTTVVAMLQRDPAQRPTMADLVHSWQSILMSRPPCLAATRYSSSPSPCIAAACCGRSGHCSRAWRSLSCLASVAEYAVLWRSRLLPALRRCNAQSAIASFIKVTLENVQ